MENKEIDEIIDNIYEIHDKFKRIIQINSDKIPRYFLDEDCFSISIDGLKDKKHRDIGMLIMDRIDFLKGFGKFINEYEIDHNQIEKLIVNQIK